MTRITIVVAVIALLAASVASADSLSYVGETPTTGENYTLPTGYISTAGWDYAYDLNITNNSSGYIWGILAPGIKPYGMYALPPAAAPSFSFQYFAVAPTTLNGLSVPLALQGRAAMIGVTNAADTPVSVGDYTFEFSSYSSPTPRPYVGTGSVGGISGTALSNPEPGTIGMALLVLGMVGMLRKRRS